MKIAVIIHLPARPEGNLALHTPTHFRQALSAGKDPLEGIRPIHELVDSLPPPLGGVFLSLMSPVFELGEILILDERGGRELSGRGRRPSKWGVVVKYFDSLADAIECSLEVCQRGGLADGDSSN